MKQETSHGGKFPPAKLDRTVGCSLLESFCSDAEIPMPCNEIVADLCIRQFEKAALKVIALLRTDIALTLREVRK